MSNNEISVSCTIDAEPDAIFSALLSPDSIKQWWGASSAIVYPVDGGIWVAVWGDENHPDYVTSARISEIARPERLSLIEYTYWAKESEEFMSGLSATFEIEMSDDGSATLNVFQKGFRHIGASEDFIQACKQGWHDTLVQLKLFCESDH